MALLANLHATKTYLYVYIQIGILLIKNMFYHKIMGSYDVNEYMYINFVYKWLVTKFMIENQIDYDFLLWITF